MWEQEFASDGASARARRRCSHFFVFRKFSRRGIKSRGPHLPEVTPCVTTKLRTTLQSTHLGLLLTPHCSPGLPTYCKPSASFLKPRMQRPLETCHNSLAGLEIGFIQIANETCQMQKCITKLLLRAYRSSFENLQSTARGWNLSPPGHLPGSAAGRTRHK